MEIYDKINKFKKSLDKEKSIIDIKDVQKKIMLDKELVNSIRNNSYNNNNTLIRKYRHLENEINYIILEVNMNLKKLVEGGSCESHTR